MSPSDAHRRGLVRMEISLKENVQQTHFPKPPVCQSPHLGDSEFSQEFPNPTFKPNTLL